MKIRVKVPKLGLTIEEVTLTSWEMAEGSTISAGDVIATVEADKANFEITAPADGTLTSMLATEGDTVEVGSDLAIIET